MRYKFFITMFCMFLIVSIPFVSADLAGNNFDNVAPSVPSSLNPDPYYGSSLGGYTYNDPFASAVRRETSGYSSENNLGEAIIVNVADYEPKQVRESLLDQSDAPVFVYLKGTTLGTVLSPLTKDVESRDFITGINQIPAIKSIEVRPNVSSPGSKYIRSVQYIQPKRDKVSLNNLGYLVIYLKKLDSANSTPKDHNIKIDLDAKIYLDLEDSSLFGVTQQSVTVKPFADEKEFLSNREDYSFFSDKGFIRATSITPDSVTLQIYNRDQTPISFATNSQQPQPFSQGLQRASVLRLTPGKTSSPISFGYTGNQLQDFFQVRLDSIAGPQDRAEFNFEINGKTISRKVPVGAKLNSGSNWVLKSVYIRQGESIGANNIATVAKKFNLDARHQRSILEHPTTVYLFTHTVDIENKYTDEIKSISKEIIGNTDGSTFDSDGVSSISNDEVEALESEYCPDDSSDVACLAVHGFKKVIKDYSQFPESKKSMSELADLYLKRLIQWPDCKVGSSGQVNTESCRKYDIDMANLAHYYYSKLGDSASAKFLFNSFGDRVYIQDEAFSLDLIQVQKLSKKDQGQTTISISNKEKSDLKQGLKVGDVVIDNVKYFENSNQYNKNSDAKDWQWLVEKISPNAVTIRLYSMPTESNKNIRPAPTDKVSMLTLKFNEIIEVPTSIQFEDPVSHVRLGEYDSAKVQVTKIDTNYEAYLTVIPGAGRSFTTSSFSFTVPVDPRPFEWTPQQLESHIKATKDIIARLDKIIKKMDDVIRTWKKVCLATFAFLTVKSSFLEGTARSLARRQVSDSFKQRCVAEKTEGKTNDHPDFQTIDRCLDYYSDNIKSSTDKTQRYIEDVQSTIKGKTAEDLAKENLDNVDCGSFEKFKTASIDSSGSDLVTEYRDCLLYSKLKNDNTVDPVYKKYLEDKNNKNSIQQKIAIYDKAKAIANTYGKGDDPKEIQKVISVIEMNENNKLSSDLNYMAFTPDPNDKSKGSALIPTGNDLTQAKNFDVKSLSQYNALQIKYYDQAGTSIDLLNAVCESKDGAHIKPVTNGIPSQCYKNENGKEEYAFAVSNQIDTLKGIKFTENNYPVYVADSFIDSSGSFKVSDPNNCGINNGVLYSNARCIPKLFASTVSDTDIGRLSTAYAYSSTIPALYDNNGLPYCYPTGKGEYVIVDDHYPGTKRIKDIRVLNVGPNQRIECGRGDDIYIPGGDTLALKTNPNMERKYIAFGESLKQPCTKDGDDANKEIDGRRIVCSKQSSEQLTNDLQPKCIDVMDPLDCKILFNACDPVMCPSSRCTLGGRVPPRNVIQSGLVGSTVLCLPNIKEGIAVPVCLTGIDAGLKGIRSILEGYVNCLEIKLKQNEDVGFCDYIRSVGVCELVWKEAYNLLDIGGRGVIDWVSGHVEGNLGPDSGGGEYLKFQSSLDNVGKSVNVFTKEYDTTYTAQFLSQSTDEIGTQICRLSVNGKLPAIGKIIDQLTEPEDPPQFEAFFDETGYASPGESAGVSGVYGAQELSLYKVFYHIYAGTGLYRGSYSTTSSVIKSENFLVPNANPSQQNPLTYSVYLVNKELGLPPVYVTYPGDFVRTQGSIAPGKFEQQTVQKVAPKGYNQLCVNINGVEQCGFGKVSSSFGVKELNNVITASQAKTVISSADQCTPEPRTSAAYSLGKLAAASPFALGLATPGPAVGVLTSNADQSLLSTGIIRVCSNSAPTTEAARWTKVGTCGKDKNNLDLGDCWLDTKSINIDDSEIKKETLDKLNEDGELKSSVKLLDSSESNSFLLLLNAERDKIIEALRNLVGAVPNGNTFVGPPAPPITTLQSNGNNVIIGVLSLKKSTSASGFDLRFAPTTNNNDPILKIEVPQGQVINLDVYESSGNWFRVLYNNRWGWISAGPSITFTPKESATKQVPLKNNCVVDVESYINNLNSAAVFNFDSSNGKIQLNVDNEIWSFEIVDGVIQNVEEGVTHLPVITVTTTMCGLQKLENKETDFSQAIQQGILTYKTKDEFKEISKLGALFE